MLQKLPTQAFFLYDLLCMNSCTIYCTITIIQTAHYLCRNVETFNYVPIQPLSLLLGSQNYSSFAPVWLACVCVLRSDVVIHWGRAVFLLLAPHAGRRLWVWGGGGSRREVTADRDQHPQPSRGGSGAADTARTVKSCWCLLSCTHIVPTYISVVIRKPPFCFTALCTSCMCTH